VNSNMKKRNRSGSGGEKKRAKDGDGESYIEIEERGAAPQNWGSTEGIA